MQPLGLVMTLQLECFVGGVHFISVVLYINVGGFNDLNTPKSQRVWISKVPLYYLLEFKYLVKSSYIRGLYPPHPYFIFTTLNVALLKNLLKTLQSCITWNFSIISKS